MKINFRELFQNEAGRISPKVRISVNGITMGPGVSFTRGVSFGGLDFTTLIGKDFEVVVQDGIYLIKGVYN